MTKLPIKTIAHTRQVYRPRVYTAAEIRDWVQANPLSADDAFFFCLSVFPFKKPPIFPSQVHSNKLIEWRAIIVGATDAHEYAARYAGEIFYKKNLLTWYEDFDLRLLRYVIDELCEYDEVLKIQALTGTAAWQLKLADDEKKKSSS